MKGKRFKEYFTFTTKERNGIIVLLLLVVITVIFRFYQNNRSDGELVLMTDDFRKEIDAFEKGLSAKQEETKKTKRKSIKKYAEVDQWFIPEQLFEFDPNIIPKEKLKKLGFSDKQSKTLINYRNSGGVFKQKSDLLKIYGIAEEQYKKLKPFIIIADDGVNKKKAEIKTNHLVIELNTATQDDLIQLKGIGESYAQRIIKYRELLGGFCKTKQLLEVYGLDSMRFNAFSANIVVDTSMIKKIDLNQADYKELIRHPYITKYQTEALLKFKKIMGNFTKIEQITENNLLTKEEFFKVKPYLKVN